ncbi:MAG TPA: acylphosphatase [Methanothrix soehngenii]|nr:acylphosphatase [Methanothrix soehngenii]
MKLKIRIVGPKVHDVGYRPFLTELAMRLALRGFEVYNDDEDDEQIVVALLEGDGPRITRFYDLSCKQQPDLAVVDSVKSEDYAGEIMPLWQFASINTASQMNKAIPLLLGIKENTDATLIEVKEIKGIRKNTEMIPQISVDMKAINANTSAMKEDLNALREDIQPGYAENFRQLQTDVQAIKERLGMV